VRAVLQHLLVIVFVSSESGSAAKNGLRIFRAAAFGPMTASVEYKKLLVRFFTILAIKGKRHVYAHDQFSRPAISGSCVRRGVHGFGS